MCILVFMLTYPVVDTVTNLCAFYVTTKRVCVVYVARQVLSRGNI